MKSSNRTVALFSAAVLGATTFASSAHALTVDGAGTATNWGVTPFTQANGVYTSASMTSVIQNNTSSVNYGGGIGYTPSGGEAYDLEALHIRNTGTNIQVLLIASNRFSAGSFHLGDLLIDLDNDGLFDQAVATRTRGAFTLGNLYGITTTAGLETGNSYLGNSSVENQINPNPLQKASSFIATGSLLAAGSIDTASHSFGPILGQNENNTWFYEFSFTVAPSTSNVTVQIDWGCGNDIIHASHDMVSQSPPATAVPEMATLGGVTLGLYSLILGATRRRSQA